MAEIPVKPEDVTKDWLQKTLQISLKSDIEILDLIPVKTEGYLSKACKAKIKINDGNTEKIFLKITLPSDDPFTAFINKYNVDTNEVKAYAETIPKLIEFERNHRNGESWLGQIMPKYYAGGADKVTRGFFLIMEDLSENYTMVQNAKGLTVDEMILSLEAISHVHALSYAYAVKNKIDWQKECPGIFANLIQDKELEATAVSNFGLFKENLEKNNAAKDLIDAIDKLHSNYKNIFPKFTAVQDSRFLVHGDFWSNNVMFGPNNTLKMFDLQFFTAGMPCLDWGCYAGYSCQSPEQLDSNLQIFCKAYYDSLKKSCLLFSLDPPFTLEEFIDDVHTKAIPLAFIFIIFFYDPIGNEPNMHRRVHWLWEKTLKFNKDFLN